MSPRRELFANRLLEHIRYCGGRVFIDRHFYARDALQLRMDRDCILEASETLWLLGLVTMDVRQDGHLIILQTRDYPDNRGYA